MKLIRYIAYTSLCSFLLVATGCHKEEQMKQSDSSTFIIQIAGEGSSSVLTRAEVVENVTTPLHLLIYKVGAGDTPVYYKKDTLTDATTKKIKCKFPDNLSISDKYDVYVVGSADGDATGISATTTKSKLLEFTQTDIAAITSKTKPYMLAGVTSNVPLDPSPTVKIVRNVCRLDLTLTDESGNAFTDIEATLSAPDRTFLFSSALRGTGLENTLPVDTKETDQVFMLNTTLPANFAGSLFFFEKMTTAKVGQTEADRVKLSIKATNASNVVSQYVIYLNIDDNYITTRNTIYEVHGTMKDGTIIINTEKLHWGEVVQTEEKPDPIVIQPKANTYLVAPSSNAILIPVAQANDAAIPAIAIAANEALTAELVWTDVKGATSGKGLALDAAVATIEVIGTGPDALLMVTPGSQLGNAVIAVKGTAGVIKWSWHIWVTDYDPEQETGQNTSGGYIFMDRNLGAKSILPTTTGENIIGNYYQFGRKDPFPTKSSTAVFVPTYKADGTPVVQTTGVTTSAENQIKNPYLWGNATGYPADLELWGDKGKKTVNDPCPSGWRVPSSNAYVDLTTHILPVVTGGRQGAFTGFYPYTWSKSDAGAFATTQALLNWTSTSTAGTTGLALNCSTSAVTGNSALARVNGHAVRCVRDLRNEKHEKEVRVFTVGMISSSKSHFLGISPLYRQDWQEGLVPLLNTNFGPGKPVDAFFKHYSYYNGGANLEGKDYDIIDLLTTHDIDVLYMPWNGSGTPTLTQAQRILDWLDADPHRVLFACFDYYTALQYMQNALGLYKISANQTYEPAQLSNKLDNDVYNNLVTDGKYGKVTNPSFKCTYDWGYFNKDEIEENGFLPILQYVRNQNEIVMAVNPTRRVFLFCDSAPFYAVADGSRALNLNGSLSATGSGDYPILMANTWAWIVEAVKGR